MKRQLVSLLGLVIGVLPALLGCLGQKRPCNLRDDLVDYQRTATQIEYPIAAAPCYDDLLGSGPPRSIRDMSQVEYWDVPLQEAIRTALSNSRVMVDLGGMVLRDPENVRTAYSPAIQETDPQLGVEAALSAFDAQFSTSLFVEKNDRRLNNLGLGRLGYFQQDYDVFQAQITKRAATGSQFTIRKNVDFNKDSSLANQFKGGAWDAIVEGEVRHPLLQGGGLDFNRIAGPGARPGLYNGVLVARVRTDMSLAEFEIWLRDFVSNVENAYWDLYFAYRDLDTKIKARDKALDTWRKINAWKTASRRGGEAENEAQAREQFFRFEEEVQNALVGHLVDGTRTNNGSTPGTFRPNPGVHANERKLRLLMGLPPNDTRLIRPADEPPVSPVNFDWGTIATESLVQREELRRQRWQIKNYEMELIAAKNFLLPNLDFVGRYRFRGFGHDLLDSQREGKEPFDNAYMDLTSGKFQEWQMGLEFALPIGFRQAHAAMRNAELRLTQARAILREQEREVVHGLSNATAEVDRAYLVLQTNINRVVAAWQQRKALEVKEQTSQVAMTASDVFLLLDAQRRYADAETRYYQSRVEYVLALRNLFFEKGALLDYCGVVLAEGPWPDRAYRDAAEREHLRGRPVHIDYRMDPPPIVSQGPRTVDSDSPDVPTGQPEAIPHVDETDRAAEAPAGKPQEQRPASPEPLAVRDP